jgi:nitrogen regulatory protein P-II 2
MDLVNAKLITIIAERLLRKEIIASLTRLGAKGYTMSETTGEGSRGIRASDWEGRNVRIETIVSEPVAHKIMKEVAEKYFANYAVITFIQDVKVMRGDKYM